LIIFCRDFYKQKFFFGESGYRAPKVMKIIEIIKTRIPAGEKIIVFSMFSSCLRTVEEALLQIFPDMETEYADGTVTGDERMAALENFRHNAAVRIMFIHSKVGGEGLNITAANHVICLEPWWTHAVHNQAIARAWRRGQTKPVHVHWVYSKGSIEEEILKMCDNKQGISNEIIYDQPFTRKTVALTKYQLQAMIDRALTVFNTEERAKRLRNQMNVMADEVAREEVDDPPQVVAWIPPLPARMIPRGFYVNDDGDYAPIPDSQYGHAVGGGGGNDDNGVEEIEGGNVDDLVEMGAGTQADYHVGEYNAA